MEKLYIATREEFLALIDEGVSRAIASLAPVKDLSNSRPTSIGVIRF